MNSYLYHFLLLKLKYNKSTLFLEYTIIWIFTQVWIYRTIIPEGYQNMPSQNMALWHMDYFENGHREPVGAGKTLKTGHNFSFYKGNLHLSRKFSFVKDVSLSHSRKRRTLNSHQWKTYQRELLPIGEGTDLNLHNKSY